MLVKFHCTKCQAKLEDDTSMGGSEVKCPQCGQGLKVPQKSFGPGITVGGFEIIRMLGEGGMGEVYLAKQLSLGRNVALKILPAQMKMRRGVAERFFKEVKLLARLDHANIVVAHEAGEDAGVMYLAMGYVDGESLEQKLRREGPMQEAEALQMIGKLAGALDYAWSEHKLLHRDIKPSNVMLTASRELKLMDFGLAKCLQEDQALTLTGTVMGTPNYMSPEQVEGNVELDCRADLYSLGATLYHMMTGKLPFAGSSVMETLRKQVNEALPDPRMINPAVSENCVTLLEIMLSKNRDQRHPDYKTLMDDIERVKAGDSPQREPLQAGESVLLRLRADALGISHAPKPAMHRNMKASAKSNRKLIIGAAAGAVLVLGIGLVLVLSMSAPKRDTAKSKGTGQGNTVLPGPVNNQSSNQATVETGKPQQDEVLAKLTKQYLEALTFSREHPEDYAGALVLLEPLGKAAAGTELEGKVNDEIERVGRVRKQAVDKAVTVLKEDVRAKMARGDFDEALKRIELDTGLVTEETKAARTELDKEVRAKKQAADETRLKKAAEAQQQKQAAEAKEKLAALAQGVAADLLKGDASGMIQKITAAKSDPAMKKVSGEVNELGDMALQSAGWPELVAKTFEAGKGNAITVEFKGGRKEQLTVAGVAGEKIKGQRQMAGGFIGRDFTLADLSVEEKLKRLGDDPRPVMKVMRGLVMVKCANDWASAGREFSSAGVILADALAKEAPRQQTPEVEPVTAKPLEKPAVEAKTEEAVPAGPGKSDITRTVARKPTAPRDLPSREAAGGPGLKKESSATPTTGHKSAKIPETLEEKAANAALMEILKLAEMRTDLTRTDLTKSWQLMRQIAAKGYPDADAVKIKDAVAAFEKTHGETETARSQWRLLDFLKQAGPEPRPPLLQATEENVKRAIEDWRVENDGAIGDVKTSIDKNGVRISVPKCPAQTVRALGDLPLSMFSSHSWAGQIRDIAPLADCPLIFLNLQGCPIEDFSVLRKIKTLQTLYLHYTPIKDLDVIQGLTNLHSLFVNSTPVKDLSPLKGMTKLKLLMVGPMVKDLSPVFECPLTSFEIIGCPIKDLSFLTNFPKLNVLNISSMPVKDLSPLMKLELLGRLEMNDTPVRDLSPLEGMPLSILLMANVPATNLNVLAGMPLKTVSLGHADLVMDISSLAGKELSKLSLVGRVTAFAPLKEVRFSAAPSIGYRQLSFSGFDWGKVPDAAKLPEYIPALENIAIPYPRQAEAEIVLLFPNLKMVWVAALPVQDSTPMTMTFDEFKKKFGRKDKEDPKSAKPKPK